MKKPIGKNQSNAIVIDGVELLEVSKEEYHGPSSCMHFITKKDKKKHYYVEKKHIIKKREERKKEAERMVEKGITSNNKPSWEQRVDSFFKILSKHWLNFIKVGIAILVVFLVIKTL